MKTFFLLITFVITGAFAQDILPTVGLKNFRAIYYSLEATTGIKATPEIRKYYNSEKTRFPQHGRVEEMSDDMLRAVKGLSGLFCLEFSKSTQVPSGKTEMLQSLAQRFYFRNLNENELKMMSNFLSRMGTDKDPVFLTCTVMTSTSEFLAQE